MDKGHFQHNRKHSAFQRKHGHPVIGVNVVHDEVRVQLIHDANKLFLTRLFVKPVEFQVDSTDHLGQCIDIGVQQIVILPTFNVNFQEDVFKRSAVFFSKLLEVSDKILTIFLGPKTLFLKLNIGVNRTQMWDRRNGVVKHEDRLLVIPRKLFFITSFSTNAIGEERITGIQHRNWHDIPTVLCWTQPLLFLEDILGLQYPKQFAFHTLPYFKW